MYCRAMQSNVMYVRMYEPGPAQKGGNRLLAVPHMIDTSRIKKQ